MTLSAASFKSTRPTSVDPVNERFLTRGSCNIFEIAGPVFSGSTKFKTPFGRPARSIMSTMCMAVSGVSVAGFKIIVQPAATAGPILRVAMPAGKFQGVIRIERPIGWCVTNILLSPDGDLRKSPGVRTASSANQRKNSAA